MCVIQKKPIKFNEPITRTNTEYQTNFEIISHVSMCKNICKVLLIITILECVLIKNKTEYKVVYMKLVKQDTVNTI